jgi:hypothetical protein
MIGLGGVARDVARDMVMNRLLLLPLALPFVCLALLSLLAFLGVVALAGVLRVVGAVKTALGIGRGSGEGGQDPWDGLVGDAHPLDYIDRLD